MRLFSQKKSPRLTRRPTRRDAGFTLVETLLAIVVFAVVGTAVAGATVVGVRALTAAHADMLFTSTLGLTEHYLRSYAALVRFPFWLTALPELDDPEHLSLPYANGDKVTCLDITFAESMLTIALRRESGSEEAPLEKRVFSSFSQAGWEYLRNEQEEAVGLVFTLTPAAFPERTITVKARFGGLPLGELPE